MEKIDVIGIMAQDCNTLVGLNNELPWKDDISTKWDMKHFKETTMGYPIIMGYKTFQGFKKPLKNRINFVIDSHNSLDDIELNIVKVNPSLFEYNDSVFYTVPNLETAIKAIESNDLSDKAYLIGGANTIIKAIKENMLNKLILTTFNKSYSNDGNAVYLDLKKVDYEVIDTIPEETGKIEHIIIKGVK